jgi:amidohydrolase
MDTNTAAKNIESEIIRWYRDLHQIPEIGENLPQTTAYIRGELDKMGLAYDTYSNFGIRAVIGKSNGPVIAFRADMDALPVREETGLPYAAKGEAMHACGHDAHCAMVLGAALLLSEGQAALPGKVVLLFQPAEETTGGAKIMIEEGCLRNPDVGLLINFHIGSLFPGVGTGQIGWKKGAVMASVDSFTAKVCGRGGHGAHPDVCVDPIPIMCEMVQSLQRIISRELSPVHGAVITVGLIQAGTLVNIIPDTVSFGGTVRTLNKEDRAYIRRRIPELLRGIAEANRASVEVIYNSYYPVTVNDDQAVDFFRRTAEKVVGAGQVVEIKEPSMGTEDIAYYLEKVPGCFGTLGSLGRHSDGVFYPHHNPKFRIDESSLCLGTAVYVQCARDYLHCR